MTARTLGLVAIACGVLALGGSAWSQGGPLSQQGGPPPAQQQPQQQQGGGPIGGGNNGGGNNGGGGGGASSVDGITAGFISDQLRGMGLPAQINTDDDGDPIVDTKVDGFLWSVYFYECDKNGPLNQRVCVSYQFYSGYTTQRAVPIATINRWNTEYRYARSYNYTLSNGTPSARIEIDVVVQGTNADNAKTFAIYFEKMKDLSTEFRKYIGFSN